MDTSLDIAPAFIQVDDMLRKGTGVSNLTMHRGSLYSALNHDSCDEHCGYEVIVFIGCSYGDYIFAFSEGEHTPTMRRSDVDGGASSG